MAKLIVGYSSSSDSESAETSDDDSKTNDITPDRTACSKGLKRKREDEEIQHSNSCHVKNPCLRASRLPVPDQIQSLFSSQPEQVDDPSKHNGRMRSFPHERGNWASHVYIEAKSEMEHLRMMTEDLITCLRGSNLNFTLMDHFHLSLSKTFVIRHHWIKGLNETLREHLSSSCPLSYIGLRGIDFLVNDEKTRTFLVLKATAGLEAIRKYIASVDAALKEYNLPPYYEEPSFHVSLAWIVGDVSANITEDVRSEVQAKANHYLDEFPEAGCMESSCITFRTGNKYFDIALSSGH